MPTSNTRKPVSKPVTQRAPVAKQSATETFDADEPLLGTNSNPQGEIHSAARRIANDESITPPEPEYADDDVVCVTVGYGLNDLNSQGFSIGAGRKVDGKDVVMTILFSQDRLARNVPHWAAKSIQKQYKPGVCRIHANEATLPEIAKRCGIRPGDPSKLAAQVLALMDSDPDALLSQFSAEQVRELAIRIGERAAKTR